MTKPIRIFEGNAQPFEPFWRVRNAAESSSGEPELELYGVISEYSWWGDEVTPALFKADLYKLANGGPVTVRLNSSGGDVIAASVIRAIIVDYPGRVTVRIDGIAASAATFVAMAGDVVKMQDTAYFMIHDPWMYTWGTEEDLKRAADSLKTVKDAIIQAYLAKTHLSPEKLSRMMSNETWMTAKEAKELGFIDEVISAPGAKGFQQGVQQALIANYVNVPAVLLAEPEAETSEPVVDQQAAERLRADARKILAVRGESL